MCFNKLILKLRGFGVSFSAVNACASQNSCLSLQSGHLTFDIKESPAYPAMADSDRLSVRKCSDVPQQPSLNKQFFSERFDHTLKLDGISYVVDLATTMCGS